MMLYLYKIFSCILKSLYWQHDRPPLCLRTYMYVKQPVGKPKPDLGCCAMDLFIYYDILYMNVSTYSISFFIFSKNYSLKDFDVHL